MLRVTDSIRGGNQLCISREQLQQIRALICVCGCFVSQPKMRAALAARSRSCAVLLTCSGCGAVAAASAALAVARARPLFVRSSSSLCDDYRRVAVTGPDSGPPGTLQRPRAGDLSGKDSLYSTGSVCRGPAKKEEVSAAHRLRIGADCCRRFVRGNDKSSIPRIVANACEQKRLV
jgi:hypothetical protein